MKRFALAVCVSTALISASAAAPDGIDESFGKFWDARSAQEASKAADRVVKSGVSFEAALARLKEGRPYSKHVPVGIVRGRHRSVDAEFPYVVHVPADYDAGRRYQVRVFLHGGVGREAAATRTSDAIPLEGDEQIYVRPAAWRDAPWWSDLQIDNIEEILDTVKRTYNVDENRVVLAGVSDGGTGAYYVAMRDTTPFSSFLPLNGYLMVLTNAAAGVTTELFPNNLLNRPFFVVNGGRDPLYPIRFVEPYLGHLQRKGVEIEWLPQPDAGHDTRWWPVVRDSFERFVREHPRIPLPDRLTWETADTSRSNRTHWLVIDKISAREKNLPPLLDANDAPAGPLFRHERRSGRVDLVRTGNAVTASTRGVSAFTLLLSPDAFDFAQPVKVVVNGRVAFDGPVQKSVATLMKWAARDDDRTMLFGAELTIRVP